ncbi:unnamed protein product [Acanthocheilonema viteae]|uniref:Uncharacterized protein n=1 Tax=Acanthocheilonema viteae TaxID=6277 RepID=A0A498S3H5_ACAVI|nr:unnamed protein product [Acanthocheilonema viteae]
MSHSFQRRRAGHNVCVGVSMGRTGSDEAEVAECERNTGIQHRKCQQMSSVRFCSISLRGELRKANVPVIRWEGLFYTVVQELIALAEFLLLPINDLRLANVLKLLLFNFTESLAVENSCYGKNSKVLDTCATSIYSVDQGE